MPQRQIFCLMNKKFKHGTDFVLVTQTTKHVYVLKFNKLYQGYRLDKILGSKWVKFLKTAPFV